METKVIFKLNEVKDLDDIKVVEAGSPAVAEAAEDPQAIIINMPEGMPYAGPIEQQERLGAYFYEYKEFLMRESAINDPPVRPQNQPIDLVVRPGSLAPTR